MIRFEYILSKLGLGAFQVIVIAAFCYFNMSFGINTLATVFITPETSYRCNVPPLDNQTAYPNLTEADILNLTTPYESSEQKYDGCFRYGYNLTSCEFDTTCVNKSSPPIRCDQGYFYDETIFTKTVITEFDLVCQNSYLNTLSTSLFYVGLMIGSLVFGNLADAFGRKFTFVGAYSLALACMYGLTFSHSIELYIILRIGIATFVYGTSIATFVYSMEVVPDKWRTFFGFTFQASFTVGYIIVGGIAYHWRNWHDIMLICSIMVSPFLLIALFIPESPRWLFIKNKDGQAKKVVKTMAKLNKVEIDERTWSSAFASESIDMATTKVDTKKYSSIDLFKTKETLKITLKVMFSWFVNSLVYYGVSLNAGSLAGDLFLNNTLNGVFEISSYIFCILTLDRIGRRLLISGLMLLSGAGLIASVIVNVYAGTNQSLITLGVVLAFIAKFGISGSFGALYNLTTELYPTVLRSNGVGLGSVAARIAGIIAPYAISLQLYIEWLPNTIFGVLGLVAGILALYFPETKDHYMMESISEAEEFYKGGKRRNTDPYDAFGKSSLQTSDENIKQQRF